MKMIRKGTKATLGYCTATLPAHTSALGLCALNGLRDGAEYKEDGWCYYGGKKAKWHIDVEGLRVWEPKLLDLRGLQTLYQKTQQKVQQSYARWQNEGCRLLGKKGSCIVTTNQGAVQLFKQGPGFWWDYAEPVHEMQDGRALDCLWLRYMDLLKRSSKVWQLFTVALKRRLPKWKPQQPDCVVQVYLDNNIYTFQYTYQGWQGPLDSFKLERIIL